MQFRYPAYKQNTPPALSDATDIRNRLLQEISGHYLLGQKGNWHGGIHITEKSHPNHVFEPVRALADGELMAWRFTNDYSRVDFTSEQLTFASRSLQHSTCFCLLRHQFARPDGRDPFEFYSLYMHLRPLNLLPGPLYRLKANRNTRTTADPASHSGAPRLLSSGTLIECLPDAAEPHLNPGDNNRYLFIKAREYKPTSEQPETPFWIALQQQDDLRYFDRFFERINHLPWQACHTEAAEQSRSSQPEQWRTSGRRNIRWAPPPYTANSPAVTLDNNTLVEALPAAPVEGKVDDESYSFREFKVLEGTHRNKTGWMAFEDSGFTTVDTTPALDVDTSDEAEALPQAPSDTAQRLNPPIPVKAGDPLGYLGQHDVLTDLQGNTQERYQVHLEVFSTEQPPAALFSEEQGWHFLTNENSPMNQLPEKNSEFLQQLLEHLGETQTERSTPEQIRRIHNQALQNGQLEKLIVQHPSEWHHEQDRQTQEWIAEIQGRVHAWARDASRSEEREKREEGYERSKANLSLELKRRQSLEFFGDVGLPGRVWHLHPIGMAAQLQSLAEDEVVEDEAAEDSRNWLKVPEGQFTFDVEGSDDSTLTIFSRVAHAPGGDSGITIGRGYDLYQQYLRHSRDADKVVEDLTAAGISQELIELLKPAITLQADRADDFYRDNQTILKDHVITRKQQYDLYNRIYDGYKVIAKRRFRIVLPRESYDALDEKIKIVLVDMNFRGDFRMLSLSREDLWDRDLAQNFNEALIGNNPELLARHFRAFKDQWKKPGHWEVPRERAAHRIWFLERGFPIPGDVVQRVFPEGY